MDILFSGVLVAFSLVGIYAAHKKTSARIALAIVSFPGFAFEVILFFLGLSTIARMRSDLPTYKYLLAPFGLPFIFTLLSFGMPLISFLVMVGVLISFARRDQNLVRWTLVARAALVLTILSYAIWLWVYFEYIVTLPI